MIWQKLAFILLIRLETAEKGSYFTTYNFEVEDWHTYFVAPINAEIGANSVWVHNAGANPCAMSVAPRGTPSKATDTLSHIKKTGNAPPGYKGGRTFKNDGRGGGQHLLQKDASGNPITYKEYDVNPYQKGVDRGAERLVRGSDGKSYYTNDHYETFTPIE